MKYGVVQSTVSGSGNIQSANQLNLGFKTSGTVTHIYVKQGEHVTQGQLLAALDPGSAEVTLEQSKATLQSAEANLAKLEEDEGETSSGQGSSGTGATAAAASTSDVAYTTDAVAYSSASTPTQPSSTTPTTGTGTPTSTSPTTTTTTTTPSTTPTKTTEQSSSSGAHPKSGGSTNAHESDGIYLGYNAHERWEPEQQLVEQQTKRRHARSEPRVGARRRQERQADCAERRTGRTEHEAVRAR